MIQMPGAIIGYNISQVFIQRSPIAIRKDTFGKLVTDVTSLLLILSELHLRCLPSWWDLFSLYLGLSG